MKQTTNIVPSILLIIFLVGFPQISETIYTPALPNIVSSLMTTNALVQWTLSVYFIGFAFGVFYWGRLSDRIGRRPTMLLGILIYGLANLGCSLSPSITWLLLSRFIQAFGASVGSVITLTIAREAFHDSDRHKLFTTIGIALSLTPAIGPFIGGYINEWFGWRANFTVLIFMSIALYIYSYRNLPETRPMTFSNYQTIKTIKVAYVLMKDMRVVGCAYIVGAINGILFSYYAEAPFIFIKLIGISPSKYGWLGLFIAAASMFGSVLSRKLSHYFNGKQIAFLGCAIMLISALLLCVFSLSNLINHFHVVRSILLVMLPMAGIILGSCSLILPVILSTALNKYKSILGTASAIFGLSYYVLIAVCTWIMGALHNGTIIPMPFYFLALSITTVFAYYFIVSHEKITENT